MENNKEIEKAAALALLDRGIAFRLPAPWLLRLFGKKNIKITVKRIRLGALVHLSTLEEMATLERMELDGDRAKIVADADAEPMTLPYRVIVTRMPAITREVAALLLNSHIKIKLFQKPLRATCDGLFTLTNCRNLLCGFLYMEGQRLLRLLPN